jgi:hypothetical protein
MLIDKGRLIINLDENESKIVQELTELKINNELETCLQKIEVLKRDPNISLNAKSLLYYFESCIYDVEQLNNALQSILQALNIIPTNVLYQKKYVILLSVFRAENGFLACKDYLNDSFLNIFNRNRKYILEFLKMKIMIEEGNKLEAYKFSEKSIITFQNLSDDEKKEIMPDIELLKQYAFADYLKLSFEYYKNLLNSNMNEAQLFYLNVLNKLIYQDIRSLWIYMTRI